MLRPKSKRNTANGWRECVAGIGAKLARHSRYHLPPMTLLVTVDPTRCPLCAQPNQCAMELEKTTGQAQPPCWCTTVNFEVALLAQVPDAARRQACICQACATLSKTSAPTP